MGNVTVDRNRGLSADRGELIIVRGRRRCNLEHQNGSADHAIFVERAIVHWM